MNDNHPCRAALVALLAATAVAPAAAAAGWTPPAPPVELPFLAEALLETDLGPPGGGPCRPNCAS